MIIKLDTNTTNGIHDDTYLGDIRVETIC